MTRVFGHLVSTALGAGWPLLQSGLSKAYGAKMLWNTASSSQVSTYLICLPDGVAINFGGKPPQPFGTDGQLREVEKAVAVYRTAIELLDRRGLIDARRVGIIGFSHTCFYVKWALAHSPRLFSAASVAEGEDGGYLQYMTGFNWYIDTQSLYGGGPFGPHFQEWIERAPSFGLTRVEAPLRITTLNPRFLHMDWEWFDGLRMLGRPVELILLKDGEHTLQRPAELLVSELGNVDWFDFWLNGHEDAGASKADQYRRWEELCDMQKAAHPAGSTVCVGAGH